MTARSREADADAASQDGFTIVEVLVAVTVLVIAMLGAALLFENAIITSGNTRNRVVAINLATAQMESVRALAANPATFTSIPQNTIVVPPATTIVNGIQYTVTQSAQFVGLASTSSSCDTPSASPNGQVLQVTESVTWPDMGGTAPVNEVTTLTPPVGVYSPNTGAIAVKVVDSTGAPAESVNVQVAGPTTVTQQTSDQGCAYFAYLPAGSSYTTSVIEGTGVGDQEIVAPQQSASVIVGQATPIQFQYDSPATIVATLPSSPPPASGMSISVANTGLQPYGQFSFAATGTTTTSPWLFPYASGYTVFAGNCTDNNPLGKDTSRNAFYPGAASAPVTVTPGGSTAATVPLYTLSIHAQNSSAIPVPVTAVVPTAAESTSFGAPYGATCLSGTGPGSAPTLGLATLSATGDSVTALPLGHWTVTVTCTRGMAACTTTNKTKTVNVWVKPDGVYAVNAAGASTTKYTAPIVMVVV